MITFSDKQRLFYNSSAEKYDSRGFGVYQRSNRNHFKKFEKIYSIVRKFKPQKILEVGAGTGIHAEWLIKKTKGKVYYWGVDISEKMLETAKKRTKNLLFSNKPIFKRADANNLPFTEGFFDMVFCSGVLHHMEHPQRVIKEMVRVLKKGGKLVVISSKFYCGDY